MTTAAAAKRAVRYFISYTRDDAPIPDQFLRELRNELGASNKYEFQGWRDTGLLPGTNWHEEIQQALNDCDFGLLLVSPAFLGSSYVTEHELPSFVAGAKPCIPVMLRRIDFATQDLHGLEEQQLFGYKPPRANRSRSFQECTSTNHRSAFAHELFKAIVSRLDELFSAQSKPISIPAKGGGPSIHSTEIKHSGDELVQFLGGCSATDLTSTLLKGDWVLDEVKRLGRDNPPALESISEASFRQEDDTWRRLLAAYSARQLKDPTAIALKLAFGDYAWGTRTSAISWLRFCDSRQRSFVASELLSLAKRSSDFDTLRLIISGLGCVGDYNSIRYLLEKEGAYEHKYPNEKLGYYAALAYLVSFVLYGREYAGRHALDDFTQICNCSLKFNPKFLHPFDVMKVIYLIEPGLAFTLYEHLRDHDHDVPLEALIYVLSARPNRLLLEHLTRIVVSDARDGLRRNACMAIANIRSPQALECLAQLRRDAVEPATDGFIISVGIQQDTRFRDEVAQMIHSSGQTGETPAFATWTLGQLAQREPSIADEYLKRETTSRDPMVRAMAWLGVAKAGCSIDGREIRDAFAASTYFVERLVVSMAAAKAGEPSLFADGLAATQMNHAPVWRLHAHVYNDLRTILSQHLGKGGLALQELIDCGDMAT